MSTPTYICASPLRSTAVTKVVAGHLMPPLETSLPYVVFAKDNTIELLELDLEVPRSNGDSCAAAPSAANPSPDPAGSDTREGVTLVPVVETHVFGHVQDMGVLRRQARFAAWKAAPTGVDLSSTDALVVSSDSGKLVLLCLCKRPEVTGRLRPQLIPAHSVKISRAGLSSRMLGTFVRVEGSGRAIAVAAAQEQIAIFPVLADERGFLGRPAVFVQSQLVVWALEFFPSTGDSDVVRAAVACYSNELLRPKLLLLEMSVATGEHRHYMHPFEPRQTIPGTVFFTHCVPVSGTCVLLFDERRARLVPIGQFAAAATTTATTGASSHVALSDVHIVSALLPGSLPISSWCLVDENVVVLNAVGNWYSVQVDSARELLGFSFLGRTNPARSVAHVRAGGRDVLVAPGDMCSGEVTTMTLAAGDQEHGGSDEDHPVAVYDTEDTVEPCPRSALRIISQQEVMNLAPIHHAVLVERVDGQQQIVACSGLGKRGSLAVMRHGLGVRDVSAAEGFGDGLCGLFTLRRDSSSPYHSLVVFSFVQSSRVMRCTDELYDVSDICSLELSQRTVAVSFVLRGTHLAQVHERGVVVVRWEEGEDDGADLAAGDAAMVVATWPPTNNVSMHMPQPARICEAVVLDALNLILLVQVLTAPPHASSLCLLGIDMHNGTLAELSSVPLDHVISCMALLPSALPISQHVMDDDGDCAAAESSVFVVLGTHASSLLVYSVSARSGLLPHSIVDICQLTGEDLSIAESIMVLGDAKSPEPRDASFLCVGLRDGTLLRFQIQHEQPGGSLFGRCVQRKLGDEPIKLVDMSRPRPPPTSGSGQPALSQGCAMTMLAISDRTWVISMAGETAPARSGFVDHMQVSHVPLIAGKLRFAAPLHSVLCMDGLVCMGVDLVLRILELQRHAKCDLEQFPVCGTPRRVVYHRQSDSLVVLSRTDGHVQSGIEVMDAASGDVRCSMLLHEDLATNDKGQGTLSVGYSLCQWDHHWICVGCAVQDVSLPSPSSGTGCIALYRLRSSQGWRLQRVACVALPSMVFCICPMSKTLLALGSGAFVYIMALEGSEFFPVGCFSAHSRVVALSSSPVEVDAAGSSRFRLAVTDQVDGSTLYVVVCDVVNKKVAVLTRKADPGVHIARQARMLSPSDLVATDMYGCVYVLHDSGEGDGDSEEEDDMILTMRCHFSLGEVPTSILLGGASGAHDTRGAGAYSDGDAPPSWPRTITLTSALGSLYVMQQVHSEEAAVLREVYARMDCHPKTQPILGNRHSVYRSELAPCQNTLDGDYLAAFLSLTGELQAELLSDWSHPTVGVEDVCPIIEGVLDRLNMY